VGRVVERLAADGAQGFHASFVAKESRVAIDDVRSELARLAANGDIEERYELVCPNCGRTLKVFSKTDQLPLNDEIQCDSCDYVWVPTEQDVLVTYSPTAKTFARVNRAGRATGRSKKKIQRAIAPWTLSRLTPRMTGIPKPGAFATKFRST
jgi:rubredoxin